MAESAILGSNVNSIGTPLPYYIKDQLNTRSAFNLSEKNRTNENIQFLANKTAWVRVVSSVNVSPSDMQYFKNYISDNYANFGQFVEGKATGTTDQSALAKNFVLFAGTSKYDSVNRKYNLRSGLGKDGAYGTLGDEEINRYGYRPMPGITSVEIDTAGRLGSVRFATINFKVWDKMQLDIIDALYFKLGYTMFIDWGHTFFYKSKDAAANVLEKNLYSSEDFAVDPFGKKWTKEEINLEIAKQSILSEGNYDGMLGVCCNFNFSYNSEGGYDCSIRVMGYGGLGDSIKINQPDSLVEILNLEIKKLVDKANKINEQKALDEWNKDPRNIKKKEEAATQKPVVDLKNMLFSLLVRNKVESFSKLDLSNPSDQFIQNINKAGDTELIDNLYYNFTTKNTTVYVKPSDYLKDFPTKEKQDYYSVDYHNVDDSFIIGRFGVAIEGDEAEQISEGSYLATLDKNRISEVLTGGISNTIKKRNEQVQNQIAVQNFIPTQFGSQTPYYQTPTNISLGDIVVNFPNKGNFLQSDTSELTALKKVINDDYSIDNEQFKSISVSYTQNTAMSYKIAVVYEKYGLADYKKLPDSDKYQFSAGTSNSPWKQISLSDEQVINNVIDAQNFQLAYIQQTKDNKNLVYVLRSSVSDTLTTNVHYSTTSAGGSSLEGDKLLDVTYNSKVWILVTDSSLFSNVTTKKNKETFSNYDEYQKKLSDQNNPQPEEPKFEPPPPIDLGQTQKDEKDKYKSGLEIALRAIQLHSINQVTNKDPNSDLTDVVVVDLNEKTSTSDQSIAKKIFGYNGIYSTIYDRLLTSYDSTKNKNVSLDEATQYFLSNQSREERFFTNAKYGFAASLMSGRIFSEDFFNTGSLYAVDHKKMLKSCVVPYFINNSFVGSSAIPINHPTYITFGTLVMLLNHMCLMYDTQNQKRNANQVTPLIYIDYNVENNLCLSSPQHMSVNPLQFLIPFYGGKEGYTKLFEDSVLEQNRTAIKGVKDKSIESEKVFDPGTQDLLSSDIDSFAPFKNTTSSGDKSKSQAYAGRLMNVLINIDYLLSTIKGFASADGNNSVYLRAFLEMVLSDMNKSLGSYGIFRLAYNDRANVYHVIDDQMLPPDLTDYSLPYNDTKSNLPLYGNKSIARNLEIRTEVSSRLASMLAISSNQTPDSKYGLSQDGTPFGFINSNFTDRYVPFKQGVSVTNKSSSLDADVESAQHFNEAVASFFSSKNVSQDSISYAINYYTERMSKAKSTDAASRASAMIPVSLNFTTDGIGGITMYQSFTADEELLPYTYTLRKAENFNDKDYNNKVGFCIVGLTHKIESNQWTTDVRSNMVYVKKPQDYTGAITLGTSKASFMGQNIGQNYGSFNTPQTNFIGNSVSAKTSAESYLGRSMTDLEFSELVSATFAEASANQTERAYVMGVILNRTRNSNGKTISQILREPNQFQAITGTRFNPGPSAQFVSGPDQSSANSIYGAAVNLLSSVPKNYESFTAANLSAYGPGTNPNYIQQLLSKGGIRIGETIFSK